MEMTLKEDENAMNAHGNDLNGDRNAMNCSDLSETRAKNILSQLQDREHSSIEP